MYTDVLYALYSCLPNDTIVLCTPTTNTYWNKRRHVHNNEMINEQIKINHVTHCLQAKPNQTPHLNPY